MFTSIFLSYLFIPRNWWINSTTYEYTMASKAAACNGNTILHHTGPNDHSGELWFARVTGIVTTTNARWETAWLLTTTIKLLSLVVFLCRLNLFHSTRTINMFAITLSTKIALYIIRMEIWKRSGMAVGSISVVESGLRQKQETSIGWNEWTG